MTDDPRDRGGEAAPVTEVAKQPIQPEVQETETEDEVEEQPDTESEGETEAAPAEKPQGQSQEARRRDRDRQKIERLQLEVKELRSRASVGQFENTQAAVERIIGKPPKEEDFRGDYLAFERVMTAYELDKRQTEREVRHMAARDQQLRAEQMRQAAEAHQDRVEDFRERTPDFDQVLQQAKAAGLKASPVVEDLILESDQSAHLIYYLARNPGTLDQLNQMTDRQAARAIGSIESRLSVPTRRTNQQTRAPQPFRPLTGGAAPGSPDRDLDAYISRKYGQR